MAVVSVADGVLTVEVEGWDRFWALRSRIEIPLRHVRGATLDPGIVREPKGLKAGGTHVPGVIVAGTFRRDGEKVFWDVKNPEKAVVIELVEEAYARLVVEVADPRETLALIEQALRTV
ncbi:hypothetical protein [Kitasatospora sp. NPDC004289]